MGKETGNCTAISPMKMHHEGASFAERDLRLEVFDLRERLRQSEDIASRHAVMLREGDHRIKNSLQIVASLMTLQANREAGVYVRDALNAAAARVRSIASIHDALQGTTGADSVDLGAVLEITCTSLQAMAGDQGRISIVANMQPLQTPVALAQPLVLAVNELVVNALRHAFPLQRTGAVEVSLMRDEEDVHITVADNGVGLPDGYTTGRGYGMKLVAMMTRQVGGALQAENKSGAHFTIRAPLATTRAELAAIS